MTNALDPNDAKLFETVRERLYTAVIGDRDGCGRVGAPVSCLLVFARSFRERRSSDAPCPCSKPIAQPTSVRKLSLSA